MDSKILAGVGVLAVLALGGAGAYVMMGGDDAPTEPVATEKVETAAKKGKKAAKHDAPGYRAEHTTEGAEPRDGAVKPADAEKDPAYEERAKQHRLDREAKNQEWRDESTAMAQQWVVQAGVDEGTGQQIMGLINKAHNTIGQTRGDIEDGVIHPREGRDEMKWAKEDLRVELKNLIGEEKSQELLTHMATGKLGGI